MVNEKRLIDANALMKYINETHSYAGLPMAAHICTMELLTYAPTVDAVEVVRCKDCTHWLKDVAGCTDSIGRCEWANYMVGAAGYCVYGERTANETD